MNRYEINALFNKRSVLCISIDTQEQLVQTIIFSGDKSKTLQNEIEHLESLYTLYNKVQSKIDGIKAMQ